jgi:hypothetical protein
VRNITRLLLIALALFSLGCDERAQQNDTGGVVLSLNLGTTFPFRVSVNANDSLQLQLSINSIVAEPNGPSSSLMDVEIKTVEVIFTRADGGTAVPPAFVRNIAGRVPVGGTLDYNITVMTSEQLRNPPLSDLLFINGGFDKETGSTNIKLDLNIRFFGETISGRNVETQTASQQIEFTQ